MPRDLVVDAAGSGKRPPVANAIKAGMHILRPLLAETGAPKTSKMLIGTVKGDIYDIGKNLVAIMMERAGFEVGC